MLTVEQSNYLLMIFQVIGTSLICGFLLGKWYEKKKLNYKTSKEESKI